MKKRNNLITIAIPLYNEVKGVETLINKTWKLKLNKEIIVIDDGSTFINTKQILQRIRNKFKTIKIIVNKRNIGKAASIQKAIQIAKGNIFIILDGDSELDPSDIVKLYRNLINKKASLVNGIRMTPGKVGKTYSSIVTLAAKWLFSLLTQCIYGVKVHDVLSGFKMFYTKDFKKYHLATHRFGLETELLIHIIKQKGIISETAVHYYPRTYKEGKKINFFDGIEILSLIISQASWYKKAKILCLGIGIGVVSFLAYTYSMRLYNTTDSLPNNLTALNLIFHHRLDLTNLRDLLIKRDLIAITGAPNAHGLIFSKTPPLLGILSTPFFYLLNKWYGVSFLTNEQLLTNYNQYIGKITASIYASLSVILIFFILLKIFKKPKIAAYSTLVYAFCTNIYNMASQANWQHAVSLFFINAGIYSLLHSEKKRYLIIAGILMGIFSQIRISNGFYVLFGIIYLALSVRNRIDIFKRVCLFLLSFFLAYGVIFGFNRILDIPFGYSDEIIFSLKVFTPQLFVANFFSLLFSYNYGLFFFSPILLFSIFGLRAMLQKRPNKIKILLISLLPTLILFPLFASFWWAWAGGQSLNARLITEALPILTILIAAGFSFYSRSKLYKLLFIIFFGISLYINILTVYFMDYSWYSNTRVGHLSQNYNAWFSRPILIESLIRKNTISITSLYRKNNTIVTRDKVYRPSLHYGTIVKLFDGESLVVDLSKQSK